MATRRRKSPLLASMQRALDLVNKASLRQARAVNRAVGKAVGDAMKQAATSAARKVAKAARPAAAARRRPAAGSAQAGEWLSGVATGPAGPRRYRLFLPPGVSKAAPVPLLMMLHGCSQDAEGFAEVTHMNRLAAREGFAVLFPDQDRLANPQGCWNWYGTRTGLADAEADTLMLALDQVCARHPVDARRVGVAGLSAGGSMAALLAASHPQRFAAVAMHSGVPPGVADSSWSALRAMRGRGALAGTMDETQAARDWPAMLIIHGSLDGVVSAVNAQAAASLWAEATDAAATPPRQVRRGQRRPVILTDYKAARRIRVTLCLVVGMGHAWSGGAAKHSFSDPAGPDASALIWRFVRQQWRRE